MSKVSSLWLARHIASRYVSVGKRSQLVSFMSAISIFGLALGVTILITVLCIALIGDGLNDALNPRLRKR